MTTSYVPSPNLVPNRSSSGVGKPSKERSYLKSRRSQHRAEKRQSILNFLDRNLEEMDRSSSPTQRRRNTGGKDSVMDDSNSNRGSRWKNPFRKDHNSSTSSHNNSGSFSKSLSSDKKNTSPRRGTRRRQKDELDGSKHNQDNNHNNTDSTKPEGSNSTSRRTPSPKAKRRGEAVSHEQIIKDVLKKYPKEKCHSFEDHKNFAIAELTRQNRIHMTPETFQELKTQLCSELKDILDAQEADEFMARQNEDMNYMMANSRHGDERNHNSNSSSGSPSRRKPKVRVIATTSTNKNHRHSSNKRSSKKSNHHHHHHSVPEEEETENEYKPSSSSHLPPESTRSLKLPISRPVSTKSLKPVALIDKDDTSATTEGSMNNNNYVENIIVFDGDNHAGTYTGPLCPQSGKPHGEGGKMQYRKSDDKSFSIKAYQGEWDQGLWTGTGTLLKNNGDVYKGQFMDGKLHGMGRYKYHGQSRVFEGRHVQGQRVEGTMTYRDGSLYKGQWYKGKRHGRGQYTFQDGSIYKGEFSEDKIHGIGQLKWPDGSKYIGEWSLGNRHGNGKEYKANGDLRFQGVWKHGKEVRKQ